MADPRLIRILQRLWPLHELSVQALEPLAARLRLLRFEPGNRLRAADQDRTVLYLLDGEVEDEASGTSLPALRGARQAPLAPLFHGESAPEEVVVRSPARVLRIDRGAFEQACAEMGYDIKEVAVTASGGELLRRIQEAYRQGELKLPAVPEVAVRVQQQAEDPHSDVGDLVRTVQADPVTSGRIIQAANGPMYRADRSISTLKDAVGRLGFRTTAVLARSVALRGAFRARAPGIRERMQTLWQDTARISALCHALAGRLPEFDADTALLAGIVHDVGIIPILYYAEETGVTADAELEACITELRAPIGLLVLQRWGMDDRFGAVVNEAHDWRRDTEGNPDYCDIVLMARVLRHATPEDEALEALEALPAYRNLGLARLGGGSMAGLLEEAEADVATLEALLRG
jgi:HD-like signal output (HDOD) protein